MSGPFQRCSSIRRVILRNPVPITPFDRWNWLGFGTDTIYVPSGTRQAYIDAEYLSSASTIKHIIEWHKLQIAVSGYGICDADTTTFIATGDTVHLTIEAGPGYKLWSLQVTDEQGNPVSVNADYSFVMPESNARVQATFVDYYQSVEWPTQDTTPQAQKILRDGQIFILRDGKMYTILGQEAQ